MYLERLDQYRELLESGTHTGQDYSLLGKNPHSRYTTLKYCLQHFNGYKHKRIIELGTTRSFVNGGLEGCNLDDESYWQPDNIASWDWGAGAFTLVVCNCLQDYYLDTVDLIKSHINRCKIMTKPFADHIGYHLSDSVEFLKKYKGQADLIYMDTCDMWPLEPGAINHLEEAKVIVERNLLSLNGLILIDDIGNTTPLKMGETSKLGKGKYSVPYFLSQGFKIVKNEYQIILRKI